MDVKTLFDLSDRVAVVTGGAGRLGSQMAWGLGEADAHVVVAGLHQPRCDELVEQLSEKHPRALGLQFDMTDSASVARMADTVMREFGRLDILVNCAVSFVRKPVEDMTKDEWKQSVNGILTSVFLYSQAALGPMKAQGSGSIINISSIYGIVASDRRIYDPAGWVAAGVHEAGKAGVINLTRHCAVRWANYGIRVNCISPGGFLGERDRVVNALYSARCPLGRMGSDIDLKGAVVYLASAA